MPTQQLWLSPLEPNGETRPDLLGRNATIVANIMDYIVAANSEAVVIIVTNPVTHVAIRHSGLPPERIFIPVQSSTAPASATSLPNIESIPVMYTPISLVNMATVVAAWSRLTLPVYRSQITVPYVAAGDGWQTIKDSIVQQVRDQLPIIDLWQHLLHPLALTRIVGAVLRNE